MTMTEQVSQERWQEAQAIEAQLWGGIVMDLPYLVQVVHDHLQFQQRLSLALLSQLLDQKEVLELGVGPLGLSLTSLYPDKARIKALVKVEPLPRIDLTQSALMGAPQTQKFLEWLHELTEDGQYVQTPAESLSYESAFDTVITSNVLDHVQAPTSVLQNAYRALRPGGQILVAVNCFSLLGYLKFEYITRKTRRGTILVDSHPHTFLPHHVEQMLQQTGFSNISVLGLPNWIGRLMGSSATTSMPIFLAEKSG